jgi:hypothetical protein
MKQMMQLSRVAQYRNDTFCKVDVTLPGVRGASEVHGTGGVDALFSEANAHGSRARGLRPHPGKPPRDNEAAFVPNGARRLASAACVPNWPRARGVDLKFSADCKRAPISDGYG